MSLIFLLVNKKRERVEFEIGIEDEKGMNKKQFPKNILVCSDDNYTYSKY
jgi:hypothetical protein